MEVFRGIKNAIIPSLILWGLLVLDVHSAYGADLKVLSSSVIVNTAKTLVITDKCEYMPIQIKGTLDRIKPQFFKADKGKTLRFIIQSNKHLMDSAIIDSTGKVIIPQKETPYLMEFSVDCSDAEIYSDRIILTRLNGQKEEFNGKYQMYVIDEKNASHSPVQNYLALTGSDAAAGTISAPWLTCAKVNRTTFEAGSLIHFGTGVFGSTQNDTCLVIPSSGSAGLPITFEGEGASNTVISSAAPKNIYGTGTGWVAFGAVANTWYHLLAKDDSCNACWNAGVLMTRVMTAKPASNNNFSVRTAADATLDSLVIYITTTGDTTDVWRGKVGGINGTSKSYVTIQNLKVSKCYNVNAQITGDHIIFSRCEFDSASANGIYAQADPTNIIYCLFKNNNNSGISGYTNNTTIYNCTIIGSSKSIALASGKTGWIFKNNILVSPVDYLIYAPVAFTSSNNLYYSTSYKDRWYDGSTVYSTLATWQAGTLQDANSKTDNPLFNSDYSVPYNSPARNSSAGVSLTSDFLGKPVSGTIGAIEYWSSSLKPLKPIFDGNNAPIFRGW